ncbi:hypothetical protein WJX74_004793 [Apatococcus lobatus]|uniref:Uncharacterized protein n=1 Tax=Apatococcus lobatus TaxID=904363 RepID=A0AAW1QYV0_9CHLO
MNARCQFDIKGNGQAGVVTSASITCETADGTDVLMYMGSSLMAFQANFKGSVYITDRATSVFRGASITGSQGQYDQITGYGIIQNSFVASATNGNSINTDWTSAQLAAYNAILASIPGLSG